MELNPIMRANQLLIADFKNFARSYVRNTLLD